MSRREESTSAAEKKESSEVMVVASSSRRLRTLSTWGKIRVPSLSVENSKKNVIVGVKISQVMKQMTNRWQRPPLGTFLFFSFSFLSYFWKPNTTRTEVCQHTFRWNAAAKIFLQVVRSVQQRLQLLCKHFVVGFTLNTKWEEKHEALRTLTWCKNSITFVCVVFLSTTKYTLYRDIMHHIEQPQKHHKCKSSETSLPQEDLHKLPPQEQGCCCWTLRGSDGEYSAPVPTSAALPQTAPSLVKNQQHASNQELVCVGVENHVQNQLLW